MAFFALSGITGCVSPASGETLSAYGVMYNDEKIITYYKKDIGKSKANDFTYQFIVVIVFDNASHAQNYIFTNEGDRNNFYSTLP